MKMPIRSGLKPIAALLALALLPNFAPAQSLWRDDVSRSMFIDKRGTAVGDIITILIEENSTETKNNETKTERQSSLSAAITSFLYPPNGSSGILMHNGQMPAMAYNSDHKHDGSGSINNAENIVATIAVRIVDVLPNGNLVVEGRRETSFSHEHQTIVLHGIVRADDVQSGNTVYSYNVADATIQIIGKGTVSDSQNKGWFNRIWDKINPF